MQKGVAADEKADEDKDNRFLQIHEQDRLNSIRLLSEAVTLHLVQGRTTMESSFSILCCP